MAEFFEWNPITGIKTETEYNSETGELTLIRTADVESVVNFANKVRNEGGLNKEGIAEGWWAYASIPPIVQLQMLAKGIDISKEDHHARMFQEINEHYPHLKLTTGREGKASSTKYFMPKNG